MNTTRRVYRNSPISLSPSPPLPFLPSSFLPTLSHPVYLPPSVLPSLLCLPPTLPVPISPTSPYIISSSLLHLYLSPSFLPTLSLSPLPFSLTLNRHLMENPPDHRMVGFESIPVLNHFRNTPAKVLFNHFSVS